MKNSIVKKRKYQNLIDKRASSDDIPVYSDDILNIKSNAKACEGENTEQKHPFYFYCKKVLACHFLIIELRDLSNLDHNIVEI